MAGFGSGFRLSIRLSVRLTYKQCVTRFLWIQNFDNAKVQWLEAYMMFSFGPILLPGYQLVCLVSLWQQIKKIGHKINNIPIKHMPIRYFDQI